MPPSNYLKIGHWNVNGLKNKLNDQEFFHIISDYDIIVLTETWLTKHISVPNFYAHCQNARKVNSTCGRYSGGIVILINQKHRKHIKISTKKESDYGLWLKINKDILNLDKNLYIGGIYLPPINSTYAEKNIFETMEKDFSDFLIDGYILVVGDLNSRSGNLNDFLVRYKGDDMVNLDLSQKYEDEPNPRFNTDSEVNQYGRKMVQMCINSNLLIMNGRVEGDIPGRYTCHNSQGTSVVDYGLISSELIRNVVYFQVQEPNVWSDHSCIKVCLKLPWNRYRDKNQTVLKPLNDKFVWNAQSTRDYKNTVKTKFISSAIKKVIDNNYDTSDKDLDQICQDVTSIYKISADLCLKKKKSGQKTKPNARFKPDQTLFFNLKKDLKSLGQLLSKHPKDPFLRGKFFYLKRNFKRVLKKQQKAQKERILEELNNLENNNPTVFWNFVNCLRNERKTNNEIDPDTFYNHFKSLHQGIRNDYFDMNFKNHIEKSLKHNNVVQWNDILDKSITVKEITDMTKDLKNRKACGFDSIINEMIKCTVQTMSNVLLKLFNHILKSEKFPKAWADGYICPLYKKKGDISDPANYRGITISSCLGKLFTKIINKRFLRFLGENDIIKVNQIGFTPGKRTSDHTFVLKTLTDQAKNLKHPLYLCFVDLKSAFDTVWRDGLVYKLVRMRASKKFLNILIDMYNKVQCRIKTKLGFTETFPVEVGTRQGCNLSPSLFNCYLNDLPSILDKFECNQPKLWDLQISCLMYADDLILISKSPSGLQKMISVTEQFCNKWQLTINTNKTKIMVICKKNVNFTWRIYNKQLEIVQVYCYLGLEIDNKGNFKRAVNRLFNKASRAYHAIREHFNFYNGTSVRILLKLFDSMIQSITTFGSELWGVFGWRKNEKKCIENYLMSHSHKFEKLHGMFCKQTLGLNKSSPDLLAKAELGRYPVMGSIIKLSYGFWQHILNSNEETLVHKALLQCIAMDRRGFSTYYTRIKSLLATLEVKNKIYPVNDHNYKKDMWHIYDKFCAMYNNFFFNYLNKRNNNDSKGKYEIYCSVKRNYTAEKYLFEIKDHKLRGIFTGLRAASNPFPINKLRKFGIEREHRYCHLCDKNKLGTEIHVLMFCTNSDITKLRSSLLKEMYNLSPQLKGLSKEQLFFYVLLGIEISTVLKIAIFTEKVLKLL